MKGRLNSNAITNTHDVSLRRSLLLGNESGGGSGGSSSNGGNSGGSDSSGGGGGGSSSSGSSSGSSGGGSSDSSGGGGGSSGSSSGGSVSMNNRSASILDLFTRTKKIKQNEIVSSSLKKKATHLNLKLFFNRTGSYGIHTNYSRSSNHHHYNASSVSETCCVYVRAFTVPYKGALRNEHVPSNREIWSRGLSPSIHAHIHH